MGQVTVTVNGRTYRLRCGDGEEERLIALATHVGERIDELAAEFGQVGDERLLLMAALLMADELWEVRERLDQLETKTTAAPPPVPAGSVRAQLAARRAAASASEPLQEEAS
jgi:cell division protein ZapA